MANTTSPSIPNESVPDRSRSEEEPLLGSPDGLADDQKNVLWPNLIMGTGFLAQLGALLMFGVIWIMVFVKPLTFVSAHPLLNSFAILALTQGILVLQPTITQSQKIRGTYVHSFFNALATAAFAAAAAVIFVNKGDHIWQIKSAHALVGFITYSLLALQVVVGVLQFYLPWLFGGQAKAKKLYKYHRVSGYLALLLVIVAVCLATLTAYNKNVLGIQLWSMVAAGLLILMGTVPRIKKQKLGF